MNLYRIMIISYITNIIKQNKFKLRKTIKQIKIIKPYHFCPNQVRVKFYSSFTFVRGLFVIYGTFPRLIRRKHEQTTNKPQAKLLFDCQKTQRIAHKKIRFLRILEFLFFRIDSDYKSEISAPSYFPMTGKCFAFVKTVFQGINNSILSTPNFSIFNFN